MKRIKRSIRNKCFVSLDKKNDLIDKVTGRIFEMECPLCQGVLEKRV